MKMKMSEMALIDMNLQRKHETVLRSQIARFLVEYRAKLLPYQKKLCDYDKDLDVYMLEVSNPNYDEYEKETAKFNNEEIELDDKLVIELRKYSVIE